MGTANAGTLTFEEVGELPSSAVTYFESVGAFEFETTRCNCPNPALHLGAGLINNSLKNSIPDGMYHSPVNAVYLSHDIDVRMSLTSGRMFLLNGLYLGETHESVLFTLKGYVGGDLVYERSVAMPGVLSTAPKLQYVEFNTPYVDSLEWHLGRATNGYMMMDDINYEIQGLPSGC